MRSTRLPNSSPAALLAMLLIAFVCAGGLLAAGFGATPAHAHDAAEATSPSDGEAVASAPEKVTVTFNRNPLGFGAEFSVKDAAGTQWAEGPVQIVDNVASQALRAGAPAGVYTVSWRVASSDSHPIEGTFSFTVGNDSGAGTTPAATVAPSATGSSEAVPTAGSVPTLGTPAPGASAVPETAVTSSEPFPWSIVGFAVVALGLIVALGVMARRRLQSGEQDGEQDTE